METGLWSMNLSEELRKISEWSDYRVLATGGLSKLIKQASRAIDIIDPQLTLKGLYFIWKLQNV